MSRVGVKKSGKRYPFSVKPRSRMPKEAGKAKPLKAPKKEAKELDEHDL